MVASITNRKPRCWVVIPAAGIGTRMGGDRPKQYLQIAGKTVLEYTLDCFLNNDLISATYIAIAVNDSYWEASVSGKHEDLVMVEGGQERCHSVFNALLHLMPEADEQDWVLVHDAARPCLRKDDITMLVNAMSDDAVGGCLAIPVKDTMKRSDQDDRVAETVDRSQLWHAQTPQMFRLGKLFHALKTALESNYMVTDEASAIELTGEQPMLIEGHTDNIKITRPDDLLLAEFFLQQQGRIPA